MTTFAAFRHGSIGLADWLANNEQNPRGKVAACTGVVNPELAAPEASPEARLAARSSGAFPKKNGGGA